MLGTGNVMIFFTALGICLAFVIAWILRSEKTRIILKGETERLKERLESGERERSVLSERFEDSQSSVRELEESSKLQLPQGEADEAARKLVNEMADRVKGLEGENESLKAELGAAKDSLEEVYRAVHEEGAAG